MIKPTIRFLTMAVVMILFVAIAQVNHPTGASIPEPMVVAATEQYTEQVKAGVNYFSKRSQEQLPLAENLLAALKSGNLETAKKAYIDSRPPYEEIEVYARSFEQEDTDIDARPYVFDEGEKSPEFKGFHQIERLLYRDGNLTEAIPYAEGLIASVKSLINKLNDPSNFNAALNFEGMIALATEVPAKKISSEEETWSDQSLLIFKHNWIGVYSQYKPYANLVQQKDSTVAAKVEAAYQACMKTVEPYFTSGQVAAKPYSSINMAQRGAIIKVSYQFRDAIIQAQNILGLS